MAPLRGAGGAINSYPARSRVNEIYAGFSVRIIALPEALLLLAKYHSP
jgi:hypothetical protein